MSELNSVTKTEEFEAGFDGAIKHYVHGLEGGRVLNMAGFPDNYVYKGHGVIFENDEYWPQPVDGSKEGLLIGVVRSNTKKTENDQASVGVMTHGTINSAACKYPFNAASLATLKDNGVYNQED